MPKSSTAVSSRTAWLPSGQQPETVRALVGQDTVEDLVRLGLVELCVLEGVLVAGVEGVALGDHVLAALAHPQEDQLIDLIAVYGVGQGDAKVEVADQVAHCGIGVVVLVEHQPGVLALGARPEDHAVALIVRTLPQGRNRVHRQLPVLHVEVPGNGPQRQHVYVLYQVRHHPIDVGKLVAIGVHTVVVGVALHDQLLVSSSGPGRPRVEGDELGIADGVSPVMLVLEELSPLLEAGVRYQLVHVCLRRVIRVELLHIVLRLVRQLPVGAHAYVLFEEPEVVGEAETEGRVIHDLQLPQLSARPVLRWLHGPRARRSGLCPPTRTLRPRW